MTPASLQGPLWRAIAVYRLAALGYVVVLVSRNFTDYAHPVAGWLVLGGIAAWTMITWWAYARPRLRTWPMLTADLLVVVALEATSPWVVGREAIESGTPTLAVAWLAGPVLAWAVAGGRRRGLAAAVLVGAVEISVRGGTATQSTTTGVALMLLAGVAVGHVARLAVEAEQRLQRAVELEASARERERLARGIHDSVLQVLALVQRRGAHLDGEAGELARLAGEQEVALRTLIATGFAGRPAEGDGAAMPADTDLRTVLSACAGPAVSVATPADPVTLPTRAARELGRAVGAALDNVAAHCGAGAKAWVLVENEPDAVTVTVRDEGPGIPDGRLAEAEAQGRFGVSQSILGRIADLGGTATITSTPGEGTEVELRLPR